MFYFAVLMAFMGPSMHAVCNIISAHLAGKSFPNVTSMVFYSILTNFISIPFLLIFGIPKVVSISLLPYFLIVVIIDVLYCFPYYTALKKVDTSIVAAMFSLGKILVPVLAYFMVNEKLHLFQYLGFVMVIFFNIVLNLETPKRFKINSGFWLMLSVSILLSAQSVVYKKILTEVDWISTAFYVIVSGNLSIFFFLLFRRPRKIIVDSFPIFKNKWKLFFIKEIFDQLGSVPGKFALSILPVVTLKAINSTQPLFVLVYGILLYKISGKSFKENLSLRQILKKTVCFIFIILGVYMTIGN